MFHGSAENGLSDSYSSSGLTKEMQAEMNSSNSLVGIDDVQKSTSLKLETNTPDDIICANIILNDNTCLDFTTNIKKLSGPLGNFYKGTSNELTQYGLRLYIENFYYNNVESVYIMKSDGTEYNLLESLSN